MSNESIGKRITELCSTISTSMRELRRIKKDHPERASGFYLEHGSILNAYREGDLTFDEAKAELRAIPHKPDEKSHLDRIEAMLNGSRTPRYVQFSCQEVARTVASVNAAVNVDIAENGSIVGVEIL